MFDQDLTFALIQTVCARPLRRRPDRVEDRRPDTPHSDRTPRQDRQQALRQSKNALEPYNKSTRPKTGDVAAFFCHFLGDHDVNPEKVLKKADLVGADWDDPDSVPALYKATTKFLPRMLRSDGAADSAVDDSAAGAASDSDDRV